MNVQSVLDALGIRVTRQEGDHLWALCPFHEDQTPSWRIRKRGLRSGLHWCFACESGGDLVELVKHVVGYGTRAAAKEWLEKRGEVVVANDLEVSALSMREQSARDRSFRMPVGFEAPSDGWPGPVADYAFAIRKLTPEQVIRWGIGFALEGKLAARLVVPVRDREGQLRSYMARALPGSIGRRYLYPHEHEGADTGTMFGEQAWPAVSDRNEVVVTEGAFKSLAVERAGWAHHAALGGSPLPPRPAHVLRLSTWKKVVVLADGDEPGEAAGDALIAALRGHVQVVRCRLQGKLQADEVSSDVLAAALRCAS